MEASPSLVPYRPADRVGCVRALYRAMVSAIGRASASFATAIPGPLCTGCCAA